MLAMDATTLEIRKHFFLPTNSLDGDIEWGSSAMLFQTSDGLPMVAATGKDGVLYAQHRDDLTPGWRAELALSCVCPECGCGSLSTPAFDGNYLYVGAGAAPDADLENGSIYALDPDTGAILWRNLLEGAVLAPVTVAGGAVYVSTTTGLAVFDAETGDELWRGPRTLLFSQPAVTGGVVYTTQVNGSVVAWKPIEDSATSSSARPGPPIRRRALSDRSAGSSGHLR
jgi:outer membrane protein assembly factor BamB